MPVGTPINVDLFNLSVSTTLGGVYSPISDMDTASSTFTRPINTRPVFMAVPRSTTGTTEETFTVSGMLSEGDTGGDILRAAATANTTVFLKRLFDGTNGYTQEANVSDKGWDGDAGGDFQNYAFTLAPFGTRTAVGAGLTDV